MSYHEELEHLREQGRFRKFTPLLPQTDSYVEKNGQRLLNLSSNDYLGLAADAQLQRQFYAELGGNDDGLFLEKYGLASASSRLLSGDCPAAGLLETELATAYGRGAALLFNSGYHANIGILPALTGKRDLILSDKLNHASIHDGLRLCRATHKRFAHRDYRMLRTILEGERKKYDRVFLVSESVFSMDGDVADIAQLISLKEEFSCLLYLDEAHAVGMYGASGLGKAEELGVIDRVDCLVGTFGKAYASIGAYLICSADMRDYLINHSRSLIFTTALPPVIYGWNRFVFRKSCTLNEQRQKVAGLAERLRQELSQAGLKTAGETNIIPVVIGEDRRTVSLAQAMETEGYFILPVRPPTVPKGSSRFRLSITAGMEWSDLKDITSRICTLL